MSSLDLSQSQLIRPQIGKNGQSASCQYSKRAKFQFIT